MSIIYHFIRGQEVIKLYVLFSVLEICDKLLYSFGADMLEGARPLSTSSQRAVGQPSRRRLATG